MMEESMTDFSMMPQTDQIMDIVRDFIRLKPYLRTVLPEDLARLKERLGELHPEGGGRHAADYDLFYRLGVVLARQGEPQSMGELSEALGVPLSTATRMVDWLVESGYARRLPDLEDRRIVRVALTDGGRQLYQTINEFMKQRIAQILQGFSPSERKELVSLLRKVVEGLEELTR